MDARRWLHRRAKCIAHKGRRSASIGAWGGLSILMAAETVSPTGIGPWALPGDLPLYFLGWAPQLRASLWVSFGAIAIMAALIRKDWLTTLAAMLLVIMPANASAAYLLAAVAAWTGGEPFALDALRAGLVWGGVTVQVVIVAGWSEARLKLSRMMRLERRAS